MTDCLFKDCSKGKVNGSSYCEEHDRVTKHFVRHTRSGETSSKTPMHTLLFGAFTLIILLIYPLLLNDIAFTKLVSIAAEYNVFLMIVGKIVMVVVTFCFVVLPFTNRVPKGRYVIIALCWMMAGSLFAHYPDYLAYLGQLA